MSAQNFKPGDVVMVSTPGLSERRATWATTCPKENHPATPHWHIADRNTYLPASAHGLQVRPLATIDPDADDDLSRLWRLLPDNLVSIDQLQAALREFANPTPPKPAEPTGHLAVVIDTNGNRWINWRDLRDDMDHERPWVLASDGFTYRDYADIDVAEIKWEGIQ